MNYMYVLSYLFHDILIFQLDAEIIPRDRHMITTLSPRRNKLIPKVEHPVADDKPAEKPWHFGGVGNTTFCLGNVS